MTEEPPLTKEPLRYTDHRLELWTPEAGKPWPRRLKCRRKYHKAFVRWYAENEDNFAVKLTLLKRTDTILHIGFCGVTTILTASVMDWEIDVDVVWECDHWDQIVWLDARPNRVHQPTRVRMHTLIGMHALIGSD